MEILISLYYWMIDTLHFNISRKNMSWLAYTCPMLCILYQTLSLTRFVPILPYIWTKLQVICNFNLELDDLHLCTFPNLCQGTPILPLKGIWDEQKLESSQQCVIFKLLATWKIWMEKKRIKVLLSKTFVCLLLFSLLLPLAVQPLPYSPVVKVIF